MFLANKSVGGNFSRGGLSRAPVPQPLFNFQGAQPRFSEKQSNFVTFGPTREHHDIVMVTFAVLHERGTQKSI